MRIAVTLEHFSARTGGAEAFAVTVLSALRDRGHDVTVYAVDGDELAGVALVRGASAATAPWSSGAPADLTLDWGLTCAARLHRLGGGTHREFQRIALQAVPPGRRWVKRAVYALSLRHRRIARREQRLLQLPGTHVLAVSHFVASQVQRTACVPPECLHVLHNGVETARFDRSRLGQAREDVRAGLGIDGDATVFLMVAHNLALKNFMLLARVFDRLHGSLPGARLVLLGKRHPGVDAPWFIHAGMSDCPERMYAAADVLLHPTFYDACANVVLEAMASGLAVVSSDRNGSSELIESGTTGLVLPVVGPGSGVEADWELAIRDLAERPEHRRRLGENAKAAAGALSMARYVDRFEALLEQIAASEP